MAIVFHLCTTYLAMMATFYCKAYSIKTCLNKLTLVSNQIYLNTSDVCYGEYIMSDDLIATITYIMVNVIIVGFLDLFILSYGQ